MAGNERISGGAFDINYDGIMIHVESATVTITDNSAVAQTRGVPNGYTRGSVSADVEVEVDAQNFKSLVLWPALRGRGVPFLKRIFSFMPTTAARRKKSRCSAASPCCRTW